MLHVVYFGGIVRERGLRREVKRLASVRLQRFNLKFILAKRLRVEFELEQIYVPKGLYLGVVREIGRFKKRDRQG